MGFLPGAETLETVLFEFTFCVSTGKSLAKMTQIGEGKR